MIKSLYIHIPFCDSICAYCDFSKVLSSPFSHSQYLSVLLDEIKLNQIPDDSLKTIYIGGGTPTSLSCLELEELLSYLSLHFHNVEEFTIEANPESLTKEKLLLFKKYHVNRISLGVQSVNDSLLHALGRKHTKEDVIQCINLFKECGFENFNLDFIYGLPNMTTEDLLADLEFSFWAKPKHLSYYSLQIEPGTSLYIKDIKGLDDEKMREMYDFVCKKLAFEGYKRYEVSNFSIPGYESKHNLTYWHDEEYYAVGLSASSYVGNKRATNTKSLTKYLNKEFNPVIDEIDEKSHQFEFLMLNLRLENGFKLDHFKTLFNEDFLSSYKKEIESVRPYVDMTDKTFSIKKEYLYTMDNILLKLLKE